jgi:transmembrane sensor
VQSFEDRQIVTVNEGLVKVKNTTSEVMLTSGEEAKLNPATGKLEKTAISNPNYLAYKTRILIFEQTSLKEVVRQINELYGTEVKLQNEQLENCKLTVKFENQSLDTVLMIIAETLDLKINHQNSMITLEGKGNNC